MCLVDAGFRNLTTTLHSEIKTKKASVCVYVCIDVCVCMSVCIIILAKVVASPLTREVPREPRQMFPAAGVVKLSLELDSVEFKAKQLNLQISIQLLSCFSF